MGRPSSPEPRTIISAHARERMQEMGVPEGEVDSTLRYPVRPPYVSRQHPGRWTYPGRRIALAVEHTGDDRVIVTVLWTDPEAYNFLYPNGRGKPGLAPSVDQ